MGFNGGKLNWGGWGWSKLAERPYLNSGTPEGSCKESRGGTFRLGPLENIDMLKEIGSAPLVLAPLTLEGNKGVITGIPGTLLLTVEGGVFESLL